VRETEHDNESVASGGLIDNQFFEMGDMDWSSINSEN
jgi:hypothetical protein